MKKSILAICLLIAIALLASARWAGNAVSTPPQDVLSTAETTLAAALSIEDMVNQSDVIAIGNCLETKAVWVDRTLVTMATVSVTETLKGENISTLAVALPGGVDANRKVPIAMTYPGAPTIQPGENVFLFLTSAGEVAGSYTVTGFSQGKFSIITDENGEQVVSRDLTKTALKDNKGVRRGQNNFVPLATLKAQVKGYLKKD